MKKTNLLIALINIIENPIVDLVSHYKGSNRANKMGDALEHYVKDVFCHSINEKNDVIHGEFFSYLGNQNNPPDAIIRNGDAIEVKKIEGLSSVIALNSSYPKDKLYRDDSRITEACRNCESSDWIEKDIIYAIGVSPKNTDKLKALWLIYGDCYAAEREVYQRIADKISQGIQEIPDVEFIETNELAKVKKVDPLGITDLRVRGMRHIENPIKVFNYVATIEAQHDFTVHAIVLSEKYERFPDEDKERLENLQSNLFSITDIKIKSPNNPANLLEAKLLTYAR
jgi:hypothetical protein